MNNKNLSIYLIGAIALILLILISKPFYIIDETQQVVITQFGEAIGSPITEAGLRVKMPFIQKANFFEKRLLEWDGNPAEILAKDKKFILVDTYARWEISDALRFFRSVVNEYGAQSRLDNVIEAATRDAITGNVLIEVVRNSNREQQVDQTDLGLASEGVMDSINVGRVKLAEGILEAAKSKVNEFGIELVDVRIKRINYIEEVRNKVFDRMIAERLRIAEYYRSEGMGKKAEIEGKMEKELQKIRSEAYRTAQELKGEADARAIKIYAEAYERDPEFYSFMKSLDSYKATLDEKSLLILSTDSDYLKYMKDINAK